jgi:voltage-gated potassium channel
MWQVWPFLVPTIWSPEALTCVLGRILASLLMTIGYGIIAVPTGIVTFEFARASAAGGSRVCSACGLIPHELDAIFCKRCGAHL